MVVFPFAKVNLGLHILAKRGDGYHDIATCFYPVPLCDGLEILPAEEVSFSTSGLAIPGNPSDNLILKAYRLIEESYAVKPVRIHLHKVIPMGAGLGGGSSDGAFMIRALNELYSLELSAENMMEIAARLGSDCPFFIRNKPMMAEGTGTTLSPSSVILNGNYIAIIHPGIHVSTASAYASVTPRTPDLTLAEVLKRPQEWRNNLKNDFEFPVFSRHPEIARLVSVMYDAGAFYAALSGSGSAVFGLFDSNPPDLPVDPSFFQFKGPLN